MKLSRSEVVTGLFAEYQAFAELIDGLADAGAAGGWQAPTRCTAWQVRDVAAHVLANVVDTGNGTIGRRTPDEQVREFRDREPAALAAELRAGVARLRPVFEGLDDQVWLRPSPVPHRTVEEGTLGLWYDTFVHGDDIRAAVGLPSLRGAGLGAAIAFLCVELDRRQWGPARLVLDEVGEFPVGEGGPVLRGDPMSFMLVATGRADPATFGVDERVNIYA